MSRNYSRAEYENMKRQRSIAWAKYYELKRESAQNAYLILQMVMDTIPRMNGELQRPPQLPPHITHELFDMAERLNREYTCPVCLELTTRDTVHATWCGHILCLRCYDDLKESTPLREDTKCPLCRKKI